MDLVALKLQNSAVFSLCLKHELLTLLTFDRQILIFTWLLTRQYPQDFILSLDADNVATVIKLLRDRYSNPRHETIFHANGLLKICILFSNTSNSIRTFLEK